MLQVVSLLGPSYSGKSTLAEGLVHVLGENGVVAEIIKKDAAMRALGRDRYGEGDESGGYSIMGFLRHGQIPPEELHSWMKDRVKEAHAAGSLAILEGGTRTRKAQSETLEGVALDDDGLRIFMLNLPFREVISRSRRRRKESRRYDDMLPVALAKLYGQYRGANSNDSPDPLDKDVTVLDATISAGELVEITASMILESRP